jgi:hypothetical protein
MAAITLMPLPTRRHWSDSYILRGSPAAALTQEFWHGDPPSRNRDSGPVVSSSVLAIVRLR